MLLTIAGPFLAEVVRIISTTCKHQKMQPEVWDNVCNSHGRAIIGVWHESITLAAYHYRGTGMHTLASYSFDAEMAARAVRRFGIMSVRGSSSNGGSAALRDLATVLNQKNSVILTVDGPKGPRRTAKPGIAILAARTGVPIIPHAFAVDAAWQLKSWDRMRIAKPFARVISAYGPAVPPPRNTDPETIEETRLLVEQSLNRIYEQIEALLQARD